MLKNTAEVALNTRPNIYIYIAYTNLHVEMNRGVNDWVSLRANIRQRKRISRLLSPARELRPLHYVLLLVDKLGIAGLTRSGSRHYHGVRGTTRFGPVVGSTHTPWVRVSAVVANYESPDSNSARIDIGPVRPGRLCEEQRPMDYEWLCCSPLGHKKKPAMSQAREHAILQARRQ